MRGISWLAKKLLAFQEGLCRIELLHEVSKKPFGLKKYPGVFKFVKTVKSLTLFDYFNGIRSGTTSHTTHAIYETVKHH